MIFILLALILGAIVGLAAGKQLIYRRNLGEARVVNAIEGQYQRPYVLINNVTFPKENDTTQIDHILVADTGIFVIETKNYTGWILGRPNDSQWTQVIYRKKSKFQNPVHQNYGHIQTLKSLFNLPEESFHSVVVFTGDAEFKTDLGAGVFQLHQLVPFLSADRPVLFDERKMAYIVGRIEMKRLRRSLETDEYHLDSVRRRIQAKHGER